MLVKLSPFLLAKSILNVSALFEMEKTEGKQKLFDSFISFKQDFHFLPFAPLTKETIKGCSNVISKLQNDFSSKYKELKNLNIYYNWLTELFK